MVTFILGFMVGGGTIMIWAIISQYIAVQQNQCVLCKEYHEHEHGICGE